jgi:hypothetical protein
LLVLAIIGALGGLVFARVFGAAARNENRPGGGSEDERDLLATMSRRAGPGSE